LPAAAIGAGGSITEVITMLQQGQVFALTSRDGRETRWAYRYRVGGRGSKRVQRGGFASEQAALEALERALERLRREQGLVETPILRELIDVYLGQHGGEPETVVKLRWLLSKATRVFGERRIGQLRPAVLTMEVQRRYRRARPDTRDHVFPCKSDPVASSDSEAIALVVLEAARSKAG
jgi:hypothetical protein